MIGIYKISSPSNRVYIGQSIDIEFRWSYYKNLRCKRQRILYNSFLKYGVENHIFEILEECNKNELNERERYWQDSFDVLSKRGMNLILTSTNDRSGELSKTVKEAISITRKRKFENENYKKEIMAKIMTSERNKKISDKLTGVKKTKEHSDKINKNPEKIRKTAEKHRGMKRSEETKIKMSRAKKGREALNKGTIWIHNKDLKKSTMIPKESEIPFGWNKGSGRYWIQNKELKKTTMVDIDAVLTENWEAGRGYFK